MKLIVLDEGEITMTCLQAAMDVTTRGQEKHICVHMLYLCILNLYDKEEKAAPTGHLMFCNTLHQ